MNIKNLLVSGLLLTSVSTTVLPQNTSKNVSTENSELPKEGARAALERFISVYATSIITGCLMGCATGAISSISISALANILPHGDNLKYTIPMFWVGTGYTMMMEMAIQKNLLKYLDHVFAEANIPHDQDLTQNIVRFASWATMFKQINLAGILKTYVPTSTTYSFLIPTAKVITKSTNS